MFCGKCGKQIEDTCNVCPYCGMVVKKEVAVGNDNSYRKEVAVGNDNSYGKEVAAGNDNSYRKEVAVGNDNSYSRIFVEPDENYIGSLGNSYLNSFFTSGEIKECVALLSDKRVYLRGSMIDVNSGKIERFNVQKTIDLEDITGTGFVYASPQIWKLVLAVLTVWLIIPAIILVISYLKNRNTLFFIEYAGGCIKFDASIYGLAESQDFEKQIRRAKNKLKGNK